MTELQTCPPGPSYPALLASLYPIYLGSRATSFVSPRPAAFAMELSLPTSSFDRAPMPTIYALILLCVPTSGCFSLFHPISSEGVPSSFRGLDQLDSHTVSRTQSQQRAIVTSSSGRFQGDQSSLYRTESTWRTTTVAAARVSRSVSNSGHEKQNHHLDCHLIYFPGYAM